MNITTLLYLPSIAKYDRFLRHLSAFRNTYGVQVFTDDPECNIKVYSRRANICIHKIPKIGPFDECAKLDGRMSDYYALWAFTHAIRLAQKLDLSHFLYIEHDCRFSCHEWDGAMTQEFMDWRYDSDPICGGTPVVWGVCAKGHRWTQKVIRYAGEYQDRSRVAMALEGHTHGGEPFDFTMYPNGALAIYSVSDMVKAFHSSLLMLDTGAPREVLVQEVKSKQSFDVRVGKYLVDTCGMNVFNKLAALTCSYSGWGNQHVGVAERVVLLETRSKVAVHHLKESEYSYE